jgi:Ca2+-binding RTX toxin-like protein
MRRRAALLITAVAVALVAASSVTLAKDINCKAGMIQCVGTPEDDTMRGTPTNDTIDGLGGDDTMLGRGGDDTYAFSPNWGSDSIPAEGERAGMGTDKLDFSSPLLLQPLDVDLVSSAGRDEVYSVYSGAGTLNFSPTVQIEDVKGGQFRDVIRGNDVRNRFEGNLGNDSLYGRGGDDDLIGGPGADALIGESGEDNLEGDLGDDTIDAKDGQEDTVDCGPGTGDTVFFDEDIDSVTDCENQNPSQ